MLYSVCLTIASQIIMKILQLNLIWFIFSFKKKEKLMMYQDLNKLCSGLCKLQFKFKGNAYEKSFFWGGGDNNSKLSFHEKIFFFLMKNITGTFVAHFFL